jgi:hypothetical protein
MPIVPPSTHRLTNGAAGVIYCASGRRYIEEARVGSRRLRRHWRGPIVVFCDAPSVTGEDCDLRDEGIEFTNFQPSGNPYSDKIRVMLATPFDKTLYLDTDTHVLSDPSELFELLENFDIAAAHAPGYRRQLDPRVPKAFYEFNTGVVVYRNSPGVQEFLRAWLETYEAWLREPPFPRAAKRRGPADQPAFRRCLWDKRLPIYVLGPEYNYRLKVPGMLVERVSIIHGRHRDVEKVGRILNAKTGTRVFKGFQRSLVERLAAKARRLLRR